MSWLNNIFTNQSNEELEKEQIFYQLREAQNASLEMGELLSQLRTNGVDPQQAQHMEQLNSRVGGFLSRLHQRIDRETNR